MRTATDEQLVQVTEAAKLGFPIKKVAMLLGVPFQELAEEFRKEEGDVWQAYMQGRMQGETDIRNTIMKAALNSSTPALERMLQYFKDSDTENMEIWE